MQVKNSSQRPAVDSVERALDQVGDRWTFLILREAFFGERRFDAFRANIGAAPNILTDRLKKLVAYGIFDKVQYGSHSNRFEYRLTEKGLDLYPHIVFLMRWGDRWLSDENGPPLTLIHRQCRSPLKPELKCDTCGEPVSARDVDWLTAGED